MCLDLSGPTACELLDLEGVAEIHARLGPDLLRVEASAAWVVARRSRPSGGVSGWAGGDASGPRGFVGAAARGKCATSQGRDAAARAAATSHMDNAIRRIEQADPAFWEQQGVQLASPLVGRR
mgnify:CR=1 FL=1